MDVFESFSVSSRVFKLIYYGNLLVCGALAMFLIVFIILELSKSSSQHPLFHFLETTESENSFRIPDMKDILSWGNYGEGVKVNISRLYPGHLKEYKDGFRKFHLNKYLSDRISMRRSIPDVRSLECQLKYYDMDVLPSVSIVIVFRNEPRTTLLRTLYSIIDRSPLEKVSEIILVDDSSDVEDLQFPQLEHYLSGLKQVSIIRLSVFHGPARARMYGARKASSDVIIFLQPRCECTDGWMVPLLERISVDPYAIAVPAVDVIDYETFQYNQDYISETIVGSFTWELGVRKRLMTNWIQNNTAYPLNPIIADGIFAVDRDSLFKLGGFDVNLMKEDGVNIEFSFRSWMCGCHIVLVPCSHVGYLFPLSNAQKPGRFSSETIKDSLRIADIWMGDYKHFVREHMLTGIRTDIQHPLKTDTKQEMYSPLLNSSCRSFDWFLEKVEPVMFFSKEIKRRGQIVLFGAENAFLSIGVIDDNVILQDLVSDYATFWYHLKSGILSTENKTCLTYAQKDTETDQTDLSATLKSNSWFDSDQRQYKQDTVLNGKGVSSETLNRNKLYSTFRRNIELQDRPPEQTRSDLNTSSEKVLLESLGQEVVSRKHDLQNNNILNEENRNNVDSKKTDPKFGENSYIISRLLLSTIRINSDLVRPLVRTPVSNETLPNKEVYNNLTSEQGRDVRNISGLILKPCANENDGDQWIYTETRTLQHVKSGLCMEAQKHTFGQYILNMVECDRSSWLQRWDFVSAFVPY